MSPTLWCSMLRVEAGFLESLEQLPERPDGFDDDAGPALCVVHLQLVALRPRVTTIATTANTTVSAAERVMTAPTRKAKSVFPIRLPPC